MTSGTFSTASSADASTWIVILQGLPLPSSGQCADLTGADQGAAYGTGVTGGWVRSWEPWVNTTLDLQGNRIGGWACTRNLTWNGAAWTTT